jgi:cyclopropane fatty-acyl-phospholipid synthase-like methyltransferase
MFKEIQCCRICGNRELAPILHLGNQYLTGVFPRSPAEKITCGPLELVKCHGANACGLVQLRHSYESTEMYGANYGYRSGLNRSMVEHLKSKVAGLCNRASLREGDLVLDIGSNDGTLLSFYSEHLRRVGMDPTAAKFRKFYQPGIQAIEDFFSAKKFRAEIGDASPKIITSIAMFYDLEEPIRFMEQIAEVLAEDGIWHFEQSYMPTMLEQNAYDTVCHEHLEYYGLRQIEWMTARCGLKILDVELNEVNGGSFAVTVAKTDAPFMPNTEAIQRVREIEAEARLDTMEPYQKFKARVFDHRDRLLALLAKLRADGAKVLGYGASTKGNVILQFCNLSPAQIPFIAEVNPDKFGAFTPGTNIPIISEAEAHAQNPDYLLVMPWHFRANLIEREAAYLQGGGKMIFPLPEIEIVGA